MYFLFKNSQEKGKRENSILHFATLSNQGSCKEHSTCPS